ncbi:MAG: hypothetical protein ACFFB0_19105 [Promethearchaeota archaeon]
MKRHIEYSLIGFLLVFFLLITFIPKTTVGHEWTYEGANTERIQNFSVYPSEQYFYNITGGGYPNENYTIIEVVKGNVTGDTVGIFGNLYIGNLSSGEEYLKIENNNIALWSESMGYFAVTPLFIPIDENGLVSEEVLQYSTQSFKPVWSYYGISFEHNATYPNEYSIAYWNETYNKAYFLENYTSDGILKNLEVHLVTYPPANMSLISEPSQLPPDFEIYVDQGTLVVNSTNIKLNISILDADNNNDGEIDDDYLFRILNGTDWTEWIEPLELINWNLSDNKAGNYTINVEVKNMYGITQKQIEIEYKPAKLKNGVIPGYSIMLISLFIPLGGLITVCKLKKKLK